MSVACCRYLRCALPVLLALACVPGILGRDDAGSSSTGSLRSCQERCGASTDCLPNWECRSGRCVAPANGGTVCDSDDECQIAASGWAGYECDAGADCPGQVCVGFAGTYYCAIQPSASVDCGRLHMTEVQLPQLGGGPVPVCTNLEWRCLGSACVFHCAGDNSCSGLLPVCNAASGACECRSAPDSCGPNASGGAVCVRGVCGCDADKDCVGAGFDRCYGGRCGCTDVASCDDFSPVHPGTTVVCE